MRSYNLKGCRFRQPLLFRISMANFEDTLQLSCGLKTALGCNIFNSIFQVKFLCHPDSEE
jgi:hypothetical protein